ncbi:hypothetical protein L1987_43356 [Smallanthus sonchifolius]|uniref:Uncharacterized protein n=1 Tax=Smallanthus sonchifolius TaxID=185202 RepID=A0ACB9GMF2_9ASTR|nr:hypothetical protein L1987_43356 [Smallanthus sonchifolius]
MVRPTTYRRPEPWGSGQHWYKRRRLDEGTMTASNNNLGKLRRTEKNWLGTRQKLEFKRNSWSENRREILSRFEDLKIDRRRVNFGGKDMARKLKRSLCYVCRTKGYAYWNCPTRKTNEGFKQSSMKGKEKEEVKNDAEKKTTGTNKPQLHNQMDTNWIETDYMVQDTDLGDWDLIWYVSNSISKHLASSNKVFVNYKTGNYINDVNKDGLLCQSKKVKGKGKGCDQAQVGKLQEAVDIGLNQSDKFKEIKGVAVWKGHSEEDDETKGEEAPAAEQVKVLYEDENNLIITLDEGSNDEPSMEDEDSPNEEESKDSGDYVFIDSE